jgi:hypothetical protein
MESAFVHVVAHSKTECVKERFRFVAEISILDGPLEVHDHKVWTEPSKLGSQIAGRVQEH